MNQEISYICNWKTKTGSDRRIHATSVKPFFSMMTSEDF